jgi:hypothetical protein
MSIFKLQPLYDQYVKQKLPNNEDVPPIEPTYFPFIKHLPGNSHRMRCGPQQEWRSYQMCLVIANYLTCAFVLWIYLYLTGKNVIRPGNYIRQLLEAPEKSYQPIHQFSSSTLRDAFSLRVGPVPGVSSHTYTPMSIFARTTMHVHYINIPPTSLFCFTSLMPLFWALMKEQDTNRQ